MNNSTTEPPVVHGDVVVAYVLVPFFLITIVGIAVAVALYIRRKRRLDRLRHQLLPVYSYDPSEELNEAEQEMLWREEDTKIVQGWAKNYHQQRPLLTKDVKAWTSLPVRPQYSLPFSYWRTEANCKSILHKS